jgi:hypothetical protein
LVDHEFLLLVAGIGEDIDPRIVAFFIVCLGERYPRVIPPVCIARIDDPPYRSLDSLLVTQRPSTIVRLEKKPGDFLILRSAAVTQIGIAEARIRVE